MSGEITFWFQPTTDRVVLFFVTLFGIFILVRVARGLYRRSIENRQARSFQDRLIRSQLVDRPEEGVVRELVERYKVRPPELLLNSLQQFDNVASEEITRIERENMSLADRMDRIEFLYSIRMNAFSKEPSVGGLDIILGSDNPGISGLSGVSSVALAGKDPTETLPPIEIRNQAQEEPAPDESAFTDEEITNLRTLLSLGKDDDTATG